MSRHYRDAVAPGAAPPSLPAPSPAAGSNTLNFRFNRVFDATASQEAVYATVVQPLVRHFLDGVNCTVLAYGACLLSSCAVASRLGAIGGHNHPPTHYHNYLQDKRGAVRRGRLVAAASTSRVASSRAP